MWLLNLFSRTRVNGPYAGCYKLQEGQDGPYHSHDYQSSFGKSNGLLIQEKKFNIDFQDGGYLCMSNLNVFSYFSSTSHLDTSNEVSSQLDFRLRIDFSGKKKKIKIDSTWLPWQSSWNSDGNNFSYF